MAKFITGQEVRTNTSSVEVTIDPANPLPPGRHRFQLIVEDDAGNQSEPAMVDIIVVDQSKPTAVIDAPTSVATGASFSLSGARSFDLPPGKIKNYRWVQLS